MATELLKSNLENVYNMFTLSREDWSELTTTTTKKLSKIFDDSSLKK